MIVYGCTSWLTAEGARAMAWIDIEGATLKSWLISWSSRLDSDRARRGSNTAIPLGKHDAAHQIESHFAWHKAQATTSTRGEISRGVCQSARVPEILDCRP